MFLTSRRRVMMLLIGIPLAICCSMLLSISVSGASDNDYTHNGKWVFGGASFESAGGDRTDPITLLFDARGPHSVNVKDMLDVAWPDMSVPTGILPCDIPGAPWGTPCFPKIRSCTDRKMLRYFSFNGPLYDRYANNGNNLTTGTTGCLSQWHVRLWTSKVHREIFHPNNHVNHWTAGSVHHERIGFVKKTVSGVTIYVPKHVRTTNFEASAKVMVSKLSRYCSWPKWRYLPGSENSDGPSLDYSDGYVTRITDELTAAPSRCG